MASPPSGYRSGPQMMVYALVDSSSSDISAGDFLTLGTAGYVQQAGAGDTVFGIAQEDCTAPSADGGAGLLVDRSPLSIYEYPPDTGTVTQALVGTTMDVGGAQSINIDASTDDCIRVHAVDTARNTLLVSFIYTDAGVV